MSVISRALKTAQKEKDQRAAGFAAGGTPFVVGRRPGESEAFNWKNAATIAVSLLVIVAASWTLWFRMQKLTARPVQNEAVAIVPVAETAPVIRDEFPALAESSPAVSPAPAQQHVASPPVGRVEPPASVAARRQPATRPLPSAAPVTTPVTDAPAVAAPPLRENLQSGRLRIAVEQPLEGDAARLFALAVTAHRAGDLRAARSGYERVLAVQPNDVDALNNMGVLLAATGELEAGEAMLRRAVRLAPRSVSAWNNLGTVLAQRAQHSDAIAAFEQTLALDPQHQGARVSLAQQYLAASSPAKARELLLEVIASNPAMPEPHYALGQAYEMERDWAAAIRSYSAFVRVAPARMAADVDRVQQRIQMLATRVR